MNNIVSLVVSKAYRKGHRKHNNTMLLRAANLQMIAAVTEALADLLLAP